MPAIIGLAQLLSGFLEQRELRGATAELARSGLESSVGTALLGTCYGAVSGTCRSARQRPSCAISSLRGLRLATSLGQASVRSVRRQLCFLHAWQSALKWRPLLLKRAALSCAELPAGEAGGVPKPLHRRCSHGSSAGVLKKSGRALFEADLDSGGALARAR